MVIYHKEKKQLQHLKEIKIDIPFTSIPHDMVKRSIALFLSEVLYKSIKEEEANPKIFQFLRSALEILDLKMENIVNFHLLFLMQLSKYLGFFPQGKFSLSTPFFNLQDGVFQSSLPMHPHFLDERLSRHFNALLNCSFDTLYMISLGGAERKSILLKLIEYYELHLPGLGQIKSHNILEEVMS